MKDEKAFDFQLRERRPSTIRHAMTDNEARLPAFLIILFS
jgi:hypothetical protein